MGAFTVAYQQVEILKSEVTCTPERLAEDISLTPYLTSRLFINSIS